jgi:hypothetical protein
MPYQPLAAMPPAGHDAPQLPAAPAPPRGGRGGGSAPVAPAPAAAASLSAVYASAMGRGVDSDFSDAWARASVEYVAVKARKQGELARGAVAAGRGVVKKRIDNNASAVATRMRHGEMVRQLGLALRRREMEGRVLCAALEEALREVTRLQAEVGRRGWAAVEDGWGEAEPEPEVVEPEGSYMTLPEDVKWESGGESRQSQSSTQHGVQWGTVYAGAGYFEAGDVEGGMYSRPECEQPTAPPPRVEEARHPEMPAGGYSGEAGVVRQYCFCSNGRCDMQDFSFR